MIPLTIVPTLDWYHLTGYSKTTQGYRTRITSIQRYLSYPLLIVLGIGDNPCLQRSDISPLLRSCQSPKPFGYIPMEYSSLVLFPNYTNNTFRFVLTWRVWFSGSDFYSCQYFHSLHFYFIISLIGCIVHKYIVCNPNVPVYPV